MKIKVNKREFDKAMGKMADIGLQTRNCTPGQMVRNGPYWLLQYRNAFANLQGSIIIENARKEPDTDENDALSEDS